MAKPVRSIQTCAPSREHRSLRLLATPLAGLLFCGILLASCAREMPQSASPVKVTDVALDPGVYRITVRWPARMQVPNAEALLLIRGAELAQKAGARSFFIVNASAPIQNTQWLVEGSMVAPTQIVPLSQSLAEMEMPDGMLVAIIRVFRSSAAPKGYPLYDAERILRERSKGAA